MKQLLDYINKNPRSYIVLGEIHGTNEVAPFLFDLILTLPEFSPAEVITT